MSVVFINCKKSKGPEDWKKLHPEGHWVKGRSARALAFSWEENPQGFPPSIEKVFAKSGLNLFETIKLLLIFPEYAVRLPGRGKASMNDVFVLADSNNCLLPLTVEGKVDEGFNQLVSEWSDGSVNKERRLRGLCQFLNLQRDQINNIRYQLLHRTASAIIEAKRYRCTKAMMIVQSFDQMNPQSGFDDFRNFVSLYDKTAKEDSVLQIQLEQMQLYLAWVKGDPKYLEL